MRFIPYLVFDGKAEEALNLYHEALGGAISELSRFGDRPDPNLSPAMKDRIMHAELAAGDLLIYVSDSPRPLARGDQVSIMLQCSSEAELDRIFSILSQVGSVSMPPQKTFWNAYYTNFTDRFGIPWQLNYSYA